MSSYNSTSFNKGINEAKSQKKNSNIKSIDSRHKHTPMPVYFENMFFNKALLFLQLFNKTIHLEDTENFS